MAEELNFSNDEGIDLHSWESLDEGAINAEIAGLSSRIEKLNVMLDRMVYKNDYDDTSKAFNNFWMQDLSMSGFVAAFYNSNKSTFAKYLDENSAPPWYHNLSTEEKKAFDASQHYFGDAAALLKPMEDMRKLMMLLPLKDSFRLMRTTLNFDEAGYGRDLFDKINRDVEAVNELLTTSWGQLESRAFASKRYYDANVGSLGREQLNKGYREARLRDYDEEVKMSAAGKRFIPRGDGKFNVEAGFLADMKVIDKYTLQIAAIPNVVDDLKKTQEACGQVTAEIDAAWKKMKTPLFKNLADTLDKLRRTIYEYAGGGINVWQSYRNRDDDSPYCFIKILPAFSRVQGSYGFNPRSTDPWHEGSEYYEIYQSAARALADHCKDFVYYHGHTELKG